MSEFTPESESQEASSAPPPAQESAAQPAETQEASPAEVPAAGEGQSAEQIPAEQATEGEPSEASEAEETPSVKAQARKVFMEVQKMGGQSAFEAASKIFDSFFNKSPEEAISELSRYGARYYPVRDVIITETVKDHPEAVADMLRQLHPDLEIQVGKKGQAQQARPAEQPASFDAASWARETLGNEFASEADKLAARHLLATEDKLVKLPQLEERLTRADEFIGQTKAERIQAEQGKYVDDLMTSVVEKTYRDSGLEGSPVTLEQFTDLVVSAHGKNPEADARFQAAMTAIEKGDMQTALLLKDQIRRDGEAIAFQYAKAFSGATARAINSKTQQLTQERPKVLPPGSTAAGVPTTQAPPFDEADYSASLKDIKAKVA
jgi:hypothetical protein